MKVSDHSSHRLLLLYPEDKKTFHDGEFFLASKRKSGLSIVFAIFMGRFDLTRKTVMLTHQLFNQRKVKGLSKNVIGSGFFTIV